MLRYNLSQLLSTFSACLAAGAFGEWITAGAVSPVGWSKVTTMNARPIAVENFQHESSATPPVALPCRYVCFASFTYDLRRQALYREGACVKLPAKVHEILLVLIERCGEVVTREALRERLWPADVHVNFDANVNTTVNKLRQILGDSPEEPVFIETIPRQGYSFIAKVEHTDTPPPGSIRSSRLDAGSDTARVSLGDEPFFACLSKSKWFAAGVVTFFVLGMIVGATVAYLTLHQVAR